MFRRPDKFNRPILGGGRGRGRGGRWAYVYSYIPDVNWGLHIWGSYIQGGLYTEGVLMGFYGI